MPSRSSLNRFADLFALLWDLPWPRLLLYLARMGARAYRRWRQTGLYEVLAYESTLELLDAKGEQARFHKRQQVRYLQNNIIAFQDRVWSDGAGPLDYRCAPGRVVDRYRPAQTTILLISLRQSKQRGDVDLFHVEWGMRNSFRRRQELWQTTFYDPTQSAQISVIFPRSRLPQAVWGTTENSRHRYPLPESAHTELPDGRRQIQWKIEYPRRHERYNLHWRW